MRKSGLLINRGQATHNAQPRHATPAHERSQAQRSSDEVREGALVYYCRTKLTLSCLVLSVLVPGVRLSALPMHWSQTRPRSAGGTPQPRHQSARCLLCAILQHTQTHALTSILISHSYTVLYITLAIRPSTPHRPPHSSRTRDRHTITTRVFDI